MRKMTDKGLKIGQKITIFIDERDQVAIVNKIEDDFISVTINNEWGIDLISVGYCKFCGGLGGVEIIIDGQGRDYMEDCPECNGYGLSRI